MFKKPLLLSLGLALSLPVFSADKVQVDLKELSAFSKVPVSALQDAMSQARLQQKIIDTMNRPYEGKQWWEYRKLFITTSRINAGVRFYLENQADLDRAYEATGVPQEIICAIIGVETFYGKNMGTWKVLDALYTLGFYYPKRSSYFSKEFAQYVALCLREGWGYRDIKGSYAGAMGMGQFMPTSYLEYAVDFDGDGHVNLFDNVTDAIGSVANYFKRHGWEQGRGIYYQAKVPQEAASLTSHTEFDLTASDLYAAGISTKVNLTPDEKVRLFSYALEDGSTSYGVGLNNFQTIMRYNKSPLYARAVYELSEFIASEYRKVLLNQGIVVHPQGRRP